MHKRPIGYVPGKGLPYDKKTKKNPKYANVQGKLKGKIGKTVKNYQVISNKHIVKRKGETFKRIKPSTCVKLLEVRPPPPLFLLNPAARNKLWKRL